MRKFIFACSMLLLSHIDASPTNRFSDPTIISFSTEKPIFLTESKEDNSQFILGFLNSASIQNIGINDIIHTDGDTAFTVSRDGEINSLAATFVMTPRQFGTDFNPTVHAEIFKAPNGSTTYVAQGGVNLIPETLGFTSKGAVLQGVIHFASPLKVSVMDKIVVVFSASNETNDLLVQGFPAAGIGFR